MRIQMKKKREKIGALLGIRWLVDGNEIIESMNFETENKNKIEPR